jgi:hypothetical protein
MIYYFVTGMRFVTKQLMHAYQKETRAARDTSVMKKMVIAILYHVPMGFVTKARTVIRAPKIVLVVLAVEHVLPASKEYVTAIVTQIKRTRIVQIAHRPTAAGTECATATKIVLTVRLIVVGNPLYQN